MIPQELEKLTTLANTVSLDGTQVTDMTAFANSYLDVFSRGFHYAFMAAIVAMLVSLVIYLANKSKFPYPGKKVVEAASAKTVTKEEVQMSATEIRQRIYALFAVFTDLLCTRLCRPERHQH